MQAKITDIVVVAAVVLLLLFLLMFLLLLLLLLRMFSRCSNIVRPKPTSCPEQSIKSRLVQAVVQPAADANAKAHGEGGTNLMPCAAGAAREMISASPVAMTFQGLGEVSRSLRMRST